MSFTKNMFQHVQGFRDKEVFVLLLKPLPFSHQNRMVQQMCCIFSKSLVFPYFYPYTISMLSFRTGLLQYRLSPPKAQIPAYFQKVVDTHSFVGIITQQLSNSATQQLKA